MAEWLRRRTFFYLRSIELCPSGLMRFKKCKNCDISFNYITEKQIYCSKICCNKYQVKNRKQHSLFCKKCEINFSSKHKEQIYCSLKCSEHSKEKYSEMGKKSIQLKFVDKVLLKHTLKQCLYCNNNFVPTRNVQKYCSRNCALSHTHILIKNGTIKTNSNNRGKAEIYFSKLCMNHFGEDDILCNEKLFKDKNGGLWDADIIIKSLKIAVLYDGIFHFVKVKKDMKLEQIKSRDKLKRSIILSNGYKYYTVKDLGKFNKSFVENEFYLFIHKQLFKYVVTELNYQKLFIFNITI